MKKKFFALLVILTAVFAAGGVSASASGDEGQTAEFDIQANYEASGADRLADYLPEHALKGLESAGVDYSDVSSVTGFDPARAVHSAIYAAGEEAGEPVAALGSVIVLLLLASVCRGGENTLDTTLSRSMGVVVSLSAGIIILAPAASVIDASAQAVDAACRFNEFFGAVFVGILIANGQSVSAAGFSSFLFGATEAASHCVNGIVLPALRIFLALSCISAVSGSVKIDSVIRLFEKYSKWLLSFLAVLVSSVLGISGILSASADTVSARAAKFIISSSVPVVGGSMSDAYLSVRSGMALLRNSVGAFGIIGVGYIFLPVIIRTMLWNLAAGIGEALCETLELDDIRKIMSSLSSAFSLMLGVLVFSLFLLVIGGIVVIMQRTV